MSISANNRILVIGFGSTLRGDDALGHFVVQSLAENKRSNVLAISVTQLVPELATLVASARAVIFVDACMDQEQRVVDIRELTPACPLGRRVHTTGPRELLALARSCYDHSPPAWLVAVPGASFEVSDRLSDKAQRQLIDAKQRVEQLIAEISNREVIHA
jgi:hydrogenase maturation protease